MKLSKYNIFSKIKDSDNYFIVNLLSRNADILSPEKANEIKNKKFTHIDEYLEKGYLIEDKLEEDRKYKLAYLDFIDSRDDSEVQLFFVPGYSCNFSCSYCYQDEYTPEHSPLTEEITDSFFDYIEKEFAGRKKYITIFGGEPLLPGENHKKAFKYFIDKTIEKKIDIAVVTNGYNIAEYIDILSKASIREIQITLDGTEDIHNNRRTLKNGKGTFEKIVRGIDLSLEKNIPVNLRVVVDKENISNLPELAEFSVAKGWTESVLFKTQLGRNYELHHCQTGRGKLYDRAEMYQEIYHLLKKYPDLIKFHKPAFSISKFLFENGNLPEPLFDSCPACKTEWAFDYTGNIYSCTATVGKAGESLGTFYPEVFLDEEKIEEWEERDVTTIIECKDCSMQLACGGGCGSVAKNRTGNVKSPDCRPVKELLELGISYYFINKEN